MNYSQEQVSAACARYGPALQLQGLVDSYDYPLVGPKLLWAIAGVESSFGAACGPRFEPGYWNGAMAETSEQKALNRQFGRWAAMSYGPWQVMYVNCGKLGTPQEINSNLSLAATAAVNFLNEYVIGLRQAASLQEVARIYNSGNKTAPLTAGVVAYIERVSGIYADAPGELEVA